MNNFFCTIFYQSANIVPFLYNESVLRKIESETCHRILIFCGDECLVRVNILASWWVGLGVGCTTWHGSPLNFSNSPTLAPPRPPKPSHGSLAIILALRASALGFPSALLRTNWVTLNCPPTPPLSRISVNPCKYMTQVRASWKDWYFPKSTIIEW